MSYSEGPDEHLGNGGETSDAQSEEPIISRRRRFPWWSAGATALVAALIEFIWASSLSCTGDNSDWGMEIAPLVLICGGLVTAELARRFRGTGALGIMAIVLMGLLAGAVAFGIGLVDTFGWSCPMYL